MYIVTYKNKKDNKILYLKLQDFAFHSFFAEGYEEYNDYNNFLFKSGYEIIQILHLLIKEVKQFHDDGIYDENCNYNEELMNKILSYSLNGLVDHLFGELFKDEDDEEEEPT